jgi:hypothetical protein
MARLIPEDIAEPHQGPWHPSERATLNKLAVLLPDDYTVFHGIHWARIDQASPVYGEIDFIVMNRAGRLLALEQKDTPVTVMRNDLMVQYRDQAGPKSVTAQVARNLNQLRSEFAKRHNNRSLVVDHLLYLPESVLSGPLPPGVDPSRVVDQTRAGSLVQVIEEIFNADPIPGGDKAADALDIYNYLSQRFNASPHIGLLGERARSFSSRLSSGLATWAARLEMSPYRLHVKGTAGSGKTQLALDELRRAAAEAKPSLYVCFNRPLADAMAQTAPPAARVVTLHEMGREFLEATGVKPNFKDTGVFDQMAAAVVQYAPMLKGTFATVVIDEAQDFDAEWIMALVSLATEDTRVVVLEDPAQRLYDRNPWSLPGWVVLNSPVNYRSPRAVVDMINNLALTETPIEWGGAVLGEEPRAYTYEEDSLVDAIGTAVADLVVEGFTPDQIVVLTVRGASSSPLFALDINTLIAGQHIKRFTGFGGDGKPQYTDGSILLETVYRFKGQAADAVVLVGDLDDLEDENKRNRMFVGLTRGRLAVSVALPTHSAVK